MFVLSGSMGIYLGNMEKFELVLFNPIVSEIIKFSPDGQFLACAIGKEVCIFDIMTKKIFISLNNHSEKVTDFDFSSNGKHFVSASSDSILLFWDINFQQSLAVKEEYDSTTAILFAKDAIFSASTNFSLQNMKFLENNGAKFADQLEVRNRFT